MCCLTVSLMLLPLLWFLCSNAYSNDFVRGFEPASSITIVLDGSIAPVTAPIARLGNMYALTGDISCDYFDIQCSNITLNGLGHTIKPQGNFHPSRGIQIDADDVTIKNMSISSFDGLALIVNGSHNTIENNFLINNGGGIAIFGNYTTVTENHVGLSNGYSEISIYSSYNDLTQNSMWGMNIEEHSTHNLIKANTLYYIVLSGIDNRFYLNNIYALENHKEIHIDHTQGNSFDYQGSGNYWQEYTGTDSNGDGIGDTPYQLIPNVEDSYPLMMPYNSSSQTTPPHAEQTLNAGIITEILVIVIVVCLIFVAAMYFVRCRRVDKIRNRLSLVNSDCC